MGAIYYVQVGTVLYRAYLNNDVQVRRRALIVLAGNELWNLAFIGQRSPRDGFAGTLVFLVPLLALQRSVPSDLPSVIALTAYTLWVVGYDVPGATDCGGSTLAKAAARPPDPTPCQSCSLQRW